jgi:hypothetical protein
MIEIREYRSILGEEQTLSGGSVIFKGKGGREVPGTGKREVPKRPPLAIQLLEQTHNSGNQY